MRRECRIGLLLATAALAGRAERLPVRTYTTADGLPHDSVFCIRKDSHGFLWFGTAEGLGRFDASRFVTYGAENGLPNRVITDFRETRDGRYWIATDGAGVLRCDASGQACLYREASRRKGRIETGQLPV